jgi:hypothetical protein
MHRQDGARDAAQESHLDDSAFAEFASGEAPGTAAEAHLAVCARCREELARFQESMSDFSLASLAWSERRSETLPALRPAREPQSAPALRPALGWALAALVALGAAIPAAIHFHPIWEAQARVMDEDGEGLNSPEQIVKDNQLMANVNFELSRSQGSLMQEYVERRGSSGVRSGRQTRPAKGKR